MKLSEEIYNDLVEKGLKEKYDFAGIYSISINNKIVYIGKSVNMLQRIAQHMVDIRYSKRNKYIVLRQAQNQGITIKFDVLYYAKRKRKDAILKEIGYKEGVYIRRYKPVLNYQIPKTDDWHCFTVNRLAKTITLDEII